MRKRLVLAVLAVAAMAACTRDIEPVAPGEDVFVIRAGFEDVDTRTSLSIDGAQTHADVVWNSGDRIRVLATTGSYYYYDDFSTTDDGVSVGEFACKNWKPLSDGRYAAMYPSEKFKGYGYSSSDGYMFGMVVPPVQNAVAGGVERGLIRSFATIGDASSMSERISFKNALALLRFRIGGSSAAKVKKVKLVANSVIAGDLMVYATPDGDLSYDTNRWYLPLEYGSLNSIVLEGNFVPGSDYFFSTIPCESSGFSLLFFDADDQIIARYSDKTLPLRRSRITDIGTVAVDGTFGGPDPNIIKYMQHSKGTRPVCLAVVAEGFTSSEQDKFVTLAKSAVDLLFATEPYKTYKDFFNVYIMKAVSKESGASQTDGSGVITLKRDTYFGARWGADSYGDMESDHEKVWGFVSARCPEIQSGQLTIDEVPVAMIINDTRYGGRCSVSSVGRCVAHVPYSYGGNQMSWSFPEVVADDDVSQSGAHYTTSAEKAELGYSKGDWRNTFLHEFGGHGFARLLDEYWHGTSYSTGTTVSEHSWSVPYGLNISGTYASVPWQADLLDNLSSLVAKDERYSRLGRFQGGDEMILNRWRCEKTSCMIDNRQYYSAWQRELIVKRIMELAGESFSFSDFLDKDVTLDPVRDGAHTSGTKAEPASAALPCPPLAPPMFIETYGINQQQQ